MKKGFLNSTSSSGKKDGTKTESNTVSEQKKVEKVSFILIVSYGFSFYISNTSYIIISQKELIYELDSDGNMVQPKATTSDNNNIKHNTDKNNPLQLPEVQSAMLSHLQTNSEQWATPDLLDSITQKHPKLAQGMQNPKYMSALNQMQTNPKETLERLKQTSPEIVDWLMEFCGVMGEHFTKLGKDSGNKKVIAGLPPLPSQKIREIGPLEKKALEKHQKESKQQQQLPKEDEDVSAILGESKESHQPLQEDEEVSAILGDKELHSILLDPKMQEVMRECPKGNKLNYYMSHPEIGPKLQRLVQAKLMQVA